MSIVRDSVMVEHAGERAKVMVSPEAAFRTAWVSEPVPELLQLVTAGVTAPAGPAGTVRESATIPTTRAATDNRDPGAEVSSPVRSPMSPLSAPVAPC